MHFYLFKSEKINASNKIDMRNKKCKNFKYLCTAKTDDLE